MYRVNDPDGSKRLNQPRKGHIGRKAKGVTMTEVELSTLLSQLSTSAEALNRESDEINGVLHRLEDQVQAANVGLEVWVDEAPLQGAVSLSFGTTDDLVLGWSKHDCQRVRDDAAARAKAAQESKEGSIPPPRPSYFSRPEPVWGLVVQTRRGRGSSSSEDCLFGMSREVRIAALKVFPQVVTKLKRRADEAVSVIQSAKKPVR
jgi:hypothetical protein